MAYKYKLEPPQIISGIVLAVVGVFYVIQVRKAKASTPQVPPSPGEQIQGEGDVPTDDPNAMPMGLGINLEPEELE
jgi:hypothetical protein